MGRNTAARWLLLDIIDKATAFDFISCGAVNAAA